MHAGFWKPDFFLSLTDHLIRHRIHKEHRKSVHLRKNICKTRRDLLHIRNHKRPKRLPVDLQCISVARAVVCGKITEHIQTHDIQIDLASQQFSAYFLHRHMLSTPICFSVVKHRHRCDMPSAAEQITHPVSIFHQFCKIRKFRVISSRIKMRRTVNVRIIRHRKCMRYQIVHAFCQKVIQQIFHIPHTETPSIRTEQFAHRAPFLFRIQMPAGCAHFSKCIMIKFTVRVNHSSSRLHRSSVHDLTADAVDPCHILPGHGAEIVRRSHSETAVDAVVLDHVSDILHAVFCAPCADHIAEVLLIQFRYHIHIIITDLYTHLFFFRLCKQIREIRKECVSVFFFHHLLQLVAPRKRHFPSSHIHVKSHLRRIAELRFIGEESRDRLAEFIRIMCIMRLIHALDLRVRRLFVDHIDVGLVSSVSSCFVDHIDSPLSLRKFKRCKRSVKCIRQIDHFFREHVALIKTHCHDRQHTVIFPFFFIDRFSDLPISDRRFQHPADVQCEFVTAAEHIRRRTVDIQLFPLRIFLLDQSVRVSGREMFVVEDPDFHIPLFCLVDHDIHIMPPTVAAKIIMRARFHADCLDSALRDLPDLLP